MIDVAADTPAERDGWSTVLDIGLALPSGWTLIGAQMVALHGLERGRRMPRASGDFDILVDVRVLSAGTERVARLLDGMDFELDEPSPDGVSHRFRRGHAIVDVLAPDGVGSRASLVTLPPARTVKVPGGSQAIRRTDSVEIRVGDRLGPVPRPDLLGAILVKARAVDVSDAPDAQLRDLAFLCTLVPDPRAMAKRLRGTERRWLRERAELLGSSHLPWSGLEQAEDGRLALAILAGA